MINHSKLIDGLTITQYCEDPDRVRNDADRDGVKGEEYKKYQVVKGQYTGKFTIRHKPLDNMELWQYAKRKYSE